MKTIPCFCISILLVIVHQVSAQHYDIKSPDGNIQIRVDNSDTILWSASLNGNTIIEKAEMGMDFSSHTDFGTNPNVKKHTIKSVSETIYPVVSHKDSKIKDEYTELSITYRGHYKLNFRAYNDGVAYQFIDEAKAKRQVISENVSLRFPEGTKSLFPQEESMYSHNERLYLDKSLPEIAPNEFCSLPVLFITDKVKVLFTETALHDYPGLFLKGSGSTTLNAVFPKYVLEAVDKDGRSDRVQTITKEADYIAEVSGNRDYPWRVFVITDDDRKLVESNLTYQLAKPNVLKNTDWIKPGKVAWDWYNANNIYGVDFKAGLNTATYKYYIDFASKNNIEYVILDEGWTKSTTDILHFNPDMDIKELIKYGEEKGVGIILWVLWKPLDENLMEILETYKSWGAKGIKIDFMQRNDQYMVNSYEQIAKACAELELLVDFHGAFKPSGLRRMYPNVVNYEGVRGNENNKWSEDITPEHTVTIPFIRMVAGPMDFTPGAMINKQAKNYAISFERPMSLGTRAHQVAMYVVYEAPLQMLCESPSTYYKEQETVDFITQIPTTWDETIVLHGSVGNYIVVARRHGDIWYVGGMTDADARALPIDLAFLGEGSFNMELFKDGANVDRFAQDYSIETVSVNKNTKVTANMASGGGWSAIITKK
ncbi:Retaining alpha-galactosidase precursor [Mariniflexile rhizosphaerae]|uniref:glycoside hydrolase family 97 protein n=1 Tax=unclassified Mariniflexile TaxID=2643887 RepID=UPI000CBEFC9D|nr:glycoside hydrolase family 97 protein [Mariniflexile sp. TRM1-10]AXP82205.1 Retaining alpha-galactosidase precursor [Mariniflexile sp. TRM1-10]PLB19230.1 MAG: putative alpha-glucosidase [Flavobacteriaceae bacterium FS1-H7996/R]